MKIADIKENMRDQQVLYGPAPDFDRYETNNTVRNTTRNTTRNNTNNTTGNTTRNNTSNNTSNTTGGTPPSSMQPLYGPPQEYNTSNNIMIGNFIIGALIIVLGLIAALNNKMSTKIKVTIIISIVVVGAVALFVLNSQL